MVEQLCNDSVFVRSFSDRAVPKSLQPIMEAFESLGCEFLRHRWSRNDVPHVVLQFRSKMYSVCYFGRSKTYRVFWPYGTYGEQNHRNFCTVQEVVDFVAGGVGE